MTDLSPEEQRRISLCVDSIYRADTYLRDIPLRHRSHMEECITKLVTEQALSHARETAEAREEGIRSVLLIRCTKHLTIAQQNTSEITGAECGGCIAEERDHWKQLADLKDAKGEANRTENNKLRSERDELKRRVESLTVIEKVLNERRDELSDKVRSLEAALKVSFENNGGPIDGADTTDGKAYVMIRMEDFDALCRLTGAPKEG